MEQLFLNNFQGYQDVQTIEIHDFLFHDNRIHLLFNTVLKSNTVYDSPVLKNNTYKIILANIDNSCICIL